MKFLIRVLVTSLLAASAVLIIYIVSSKIENQAYSKISEMCSQRERVQLDSKETASTSRPGIMTTTGT